MQQRGRYFAFGVVIMVGLSGCPVTDDYYLLPADEPNVKGGDSNEAGTSSTAGNGSSGSSSQGGQAPHAGTGGVLTSGTASGGDSAVGGAGDAGGAPGTGQAGEPPVTGDAGAGGATPDPCLPTTERCNGHDDDCDDVVDEFACLSSCSGFVLAGDPSHGYMFCTSLRKANWTDAKKSCEDQDMRLAWLDSDEENEAVTQKLDGLGSDVEILFGATDQGNEGDWLWVGGDQFWEGDDDGDAVAGRYSNWAQGTPNNTSNEDCALVNAMTGYWGDRSCNSTYPYVCEQPD